MKCFEKYMPALLISTSIPPNRDTAVSTIFAAVFSFKRLHEPRSDSL